MSEESNLLGAAFVGLVALLNTFSVVGCAILIYVRLRSAASTIRGIEAIWWFVVVCGAIAALAMLILYLKGMAGDRYGGMILLGSIPYFAPMLAAGVVALFLRPPIHQ